MSTSSNAAPETRPLGPKAPVARVAPPNIEPPPAQIKKRDDSGELRQAARKQPATSTNFAKGTLTLGPKASVVRVPPPPMTKQPPAQIKRQDTLGELQLALRKQSVTVHTTGPVSLVPQQIIVPQR
ncbi:hypothetical protein FRB90_012125 [Tulasnella sp. 427]|nr:hypothetical protein FRB90_012125 [Tulasnella sp. 427]